MMFINLMWIILSTGIKDNSAQKRAAIAAMTEFSKSMKHKYECRVKYSRTQFKNLKRNQFDKQNISNMYFFVK